MRIAYLVAAHRNMEQVARMIRALSAPGDTFFVHVDARADRKAGRNLLSDLMKSVGSGSDVRAVKRHRVRWGHWSQVRATLEAIKAVVDSGSGFDRVAFLSGQDYPIKSRAYIREFLTRHPREEFIESFSLVAPNRWSQWGDWFSSKSRTRYWHWHLGLRNHWLHIPIQRKVALGMTPHGGSNWWCLTGSAVEYVHEFTASHPQVSRYFRHAFLPDEFFFQTILANSAFASRITGDNLTLTDSSSPTGPWPTVFDSRWLPTLLASPKLFARKFDAAYDATVLDRLDEMLLSKAAAQPQTA